MGEKKKKKGKKVINKKLLIIAFSCLIILFIILTIYIKRLDGNNNSNSTEYNDDEKYLSIKETWFNSFDCSFINPTSLGRGEYNIFGVNDDVYCSAKTTSKFYYFVKNNEYKINYMKFDFKENENIELVDVYSLKNSWNIERDEDSIIFNLLKNEDNDDTADYMDSITDFYFKFHIKNNNEVSDKYDIFFSKLIFLSNGVRHIGNELNLKLETAKTRKYNYDGTIMFDTINENGGFDTINSYKCVDKYCHSSWAVTQGFNYSNDNVDMEMIFDGDYKILYNKKSGIVNTYGKNALWLCDEDTEDNSWCTSNGKYIYIQEKGTDKYGIIDADGNVIKDFVLNELPFVYFHWPLSLRYSIENNMLVSIKDNKYGIIEITSDKMVIDYLYDDIELINDKYFKVKTDNKWYLYSVLSNKKVINEGFDDFDYISEDIIVCIDNKILYIRDINNNTIAKIDTEFNDDNYYLYTSTIGDNIYGIVVMNKENYPDVYSNYEYNASSKSLYSK